ncbi:MULTISPECIES: hypothetical protein [unclassified Streptomyces]|uniref:hypothetical protein n=1 Tax=unclassified Streptomyces TaxID=2593676 RepID=UPI0036E890BC
MATMHEPAETSADALFPRRRLDRYAAPGCAECARLVARGHGATGPDRGTVFSDCYVLIRRRPHEAGP